MESLQAEARHVCGLSLSEGQIQAFRVYAEELKSWGGRVNLTAITDDEGVRVKHFLDSLTCGGAMRLPAGARVVDVGTGAGFPGLPLKIAHPGIRLTLVESVGKKADFCRAMVARLGLQDVQVVQARAEDVGRDPGHRERYDWAVARAVADLPILAEYLLPLVKVGGFALAQKGSSGPNEAHQATRTLNLLGGALHRLVPVDLPGVAETRYLVVMEKTACTPEKFPRRAGVPAKQPIDAPGFRHKTAS